MNPEWRKRIQIFLIILLVLSGIRFYLIYHERHSGWEDRTKKAETKPLSADVYVVPRKIHAYDLQSSRVLIGKTVWVEAGDQMLFFPYDPARRRVDFDHPMGRLPSLEKLEIKDVMLQTDPLHQRKLMAAFIRPGETKQYAVTVGFVHGDDYTIFFDNAFLIDDPHQLYKHWPSDVWTAIEQHQVKLGMNELQTSFALGGGVPRDSGAYGNRTVEYHYGDKQTTVAFENDRAIEISTK